MKLTEATTAEAVSAGRALPISLPAGLLGFEPIKHWMLIAQPEDAPFLWLKPPDDPGLAFLLMPSHELRTDYRPDVPNADAQFLQLTDATDALVFNIVTLHADGRVTVNLKGPLVLNRLTWVGKQVVPVNAADYSTQHPLSTA